MRDCDALEIRHLRAQATSIPIDLYGLVHLSAPNRTVPRLRMHVDLLGRIGNNALVRSAAAVCRLHHAEGLPMRIWLLIILLGWLASPAQVFADDAAHAEMAAALAAQADIEPAPLRLPVMAASPGRAAPASAIKRGVVAHSGNVDRGAANAAERASRNAGAPAAPQGLVHQAQAAAAAAAGHAQSQRAVHRHPR